MSVAASDCVMTDEELEELKPKKKKTSHKPPRSPKSPYLSNTYLQPKKAAVWRSLKGTGTMHVENPSARVPRELWLASLKSGLALTQPLKAEYAFTQARLASSTGTPEYLKEALGMKKPKHSRSSSNGYVPGTPDYKEKEDMYDEIIELKKMLQAQKSEADIMKTKLRRLEEDNSKKEKQIEQLLDPSKITNGLKQKILKLEQQCKEKDHAINKLQTDLKTTNTEEMKIAMETYYEEIQRLRIMLANMESADKKSESKETQKQQKVLNSTILRLSKNIKQMQEENKCLKEDLARALDSPSASARGYSDWSKPRLVRRITELERKVDDLEMGSSNQASSARATVALVSTSADQSNQTASSTLKGTDSQQECERLRGLVKKLKEDRTDLQEQLSGKLTEIKLLGSEKEELTKEVQRLKSVGNEKSFPEAKEKIQKLTQKVKQLEAELEDERRIKEDSLHTSNKNEDSDKDTVVIQSALRGHLTRQKQLTGLKDFEERKPFKSLLLLGAVALACLALDLLFLLFYSFWLCCRRRKSEEPANADCCCTAWCVIIATLVCSAGIAVGFYGNGETGDGIHRLTYSLRHANRTVAGVQKLVSESTTSLNQTVDMGLGELEVKYQKHADYLSIVQKLQGQLDELVRQVIEIPFWRNNEVSLEELAVSESTTSLNQTVDMGLGELEVKYQKHADYLSIVQKLQGQLDELVRQVIEIPFWRNNEVSLEELAVRTELYDWYRWLGYLSLLLFDVLICLLVLFGLIRNSKGTLIGVCFLGVLTLIISWASLGLELAVSAGSSDFCVSPNIYISKVVEENDVISKDILQYYLKCDTGHPNPFQQKLSGSHKALVEMQDDVAELLRSAIREYPQTKGTLEQIQGVLNSTEISLHQLTALTDCRSLHMDYVQALTGLCYDGVEGLIYLVLFSFVTALMFSSIVCSVPHTWQHKRSEEDGEEESMAQGNRQTHDNLYRVHMPSLYSCGSSYGSETSIPAAAHTVSNAPVTEYMSQNANFQNPRCENTPLIGRESPPPSVSVHPLFIFIMH
ncbi:Protein tweety-like 3 [Acipenser ruthenus]|uniref:Protein tweety homolog n=1 Tax=Acipenser ruthenus TaxID=7906 RepID=A0A444UBI6_ACIRT|nr:Protein tweety-like 3 [Acipenser ruthenus]